MLKFWRPRTTYATDDREYWGTRKVSCSGCGEQARHAFATYYAHAQVFGVAYAGLNGGIGREIDAEEYAGEIADDTEVFLSECCDMPRMLRHAAHGALTVSPR